LMTTVVWKLMIAMMIMIVMIPKIPSEA
jgi:hypothetical protein